MVNPKEALHIMAVDCCEHMLKVLERVPSSQLISVGSREELGRHDDIDLIVIGVSKYPVRRLFISQLRRIYPDVPVLILRREETRMEDGAAERIRGEFILSDQRNDYDCQIVRALRTALPLIKMCAHTYKGYNYDTVREVIRVIAEKYTEPDLDLASVAKELPMPAARLSRMLNQQVGVSFRQLLRHTRIEEAKRLLASKRYGVKEVAARVGFSDSHYFSRSFKELTGLSASEYRYQEPIFG